MGAEPPTAERFQVESRPDGTLVLTEARGVRWGFGAAGVALGGLILVSGVAGGVTVLASVVTVPLGVITLLAGVGAARHRDWVVFDPGAREIVFRRGLAAIFRAPRTVPFDDVEAILIDDVDTRPGALAIQLRRTGDYRWPVDVSDDPVRAGRLAESLAGVGGWPVLRNGVPQRIRRTRGGTP